MNEAVKTPLLRMAKRTSISPAAAWAIRLGSIVLALLLGSIAVAITGNNPIQAYGTMIKGSLGSKVYLRQTIKIAIPLLGCALAIAPCFKMRFWNIGAEGQITAGALAATFVARNLTGKVPSVLLLTLMCLAAIVGGGVWGLIPGFFKAKWNTNETLFTLMMNYVAIQIVAYATNILRGQASSLGTINMGSKIGWFPTLLGYDFTLNILIVVALTVAMFVYLNFSKHGYEISVVGESERTAKYAGIDVRKVTIRTLLLSGAICGLCGFIIVAGNKHTISTNTAGGDGFTAIIVAWLAKFNTFYMALISFLLVFLEKGAGQIASTYGLNEYIADIISGIILFCILGSEFFINYKMIFRHKEEKGGAAK